MGNKLRKSKMSLQELRIRNGLTTKILANSVGMDYLRLLEIECGAKPSAEERLDLAEELGATPSRWTTLFGPTLKLRRGAAGLSSLGVARIMGIAESTYNKWENGHGVPRSLGRMDLLAKTLGCSVAELAAPTKLVAEPESGA